MIASPSTTPWARPALALVLPGILAATVPLIGFILSLLLPIFAARARARLWPQTTANVVRLSSTLAIIGLWLPATVAIFTSGTIGSEATTWLILPLCAPTGWSLVVPALLFAACYLTGLTVSITIGNPWPWVIGAWASPLAYSAASTWLVDFACRA